MTKHYRVKKDTFLWKSGAILATDGKGYTAIEDVWDAVKSVGGEYISERIVEDEGNEEFFERVYPDSLTGKLFKTKDQLLEFYNKSFKE